MVCNFMLLYCSMVEDEQGQHISQLHPLGHPAAPQLEERPVETVEIYGCNSFCRWPEVSWT